MPDLCVAGVNGPCEGPGSAAPRLPTCGARFRARSMLRSGISRTLHANVQHLFARLQCQAFGFGFCAQIDIRDLVQHHRQSCLLFAQTPVIVISISEPLHSILVSKEGIGDTE